MTLLFKALLAAALLVAGNGFPVSWVIPRSGEPGIATENGLPAGKRGRPAFVAYEPVEKTAADSAWTFHVPVGKLDKGTTLEFDFTVFAREGDAKFYRAEYFDGRNWVALKEFNAVSTQSHPAVELTTFSLSRRIRKELRLRIRPLPTPAERASGKPVGSAALSRFGYTAARVLQLPPVVPKDTLRVLVIGNSNTYYNFSASLLKEIAWSQGHYLDIEVSTKGGQTFGQHRNLTKTDELIRLGGYDVAILQNNTVTMTTYGLDPEGNRPLMDDCTALVEKIRSCSPECRILLERGWSYSAKNYAGAGSREAMDEAVEKAVRLMAEAVGGQISPIGNASLRVMAERPDVTVYQSDKAHPSLNLSYLKSCIYYLLTLQTRDFREPVPDCGVDPALAGWLRSVAGSSLPPKFNAHRGLQPFGPENSIASFEAAAARHVWAIETDFRMTADSEVVCIHDATLDRTTDGKGRVRDHTLQEIKTFRVQAINTKPVRRQYDYAALSDRDRMIPTMDEYFEICRKGGSVAFVELKEDDGVIERMNASIRRHRMTGRCVISSSHRDLLRAYRESGGKELIHLIFGKVDDLDLLLELGNAAVAFNYPDLDTEIHLEHHGHRIDSLKELVDYCHSLGLKICFRAVDTPEELKKSLDLGIDYLPTNNLW